MCVCVCVLLSGLIGYGGLGCGFALCVCFLLGGFTLCVYVCFFFLVGLLVVVMVEVSFFFFVSCGMGGRFVVVVVWVVGFWWVVGFVVIVGIVVVNGVENSWVEEKERDRGERDREIEEE